MSTSTFIPIFLVAIGLISASVSQLITTQSVRVLTKRIEALEKARPQSNADSLACPADHYVAYDLTCVKPDQAKPKAKRGRIVPWRGEWLTSDAAGAWGDVAVVPPMTTKPRFVPIPSERNAENAK